MQLDRCKPETHNAFNYACSTESFRLSLKTASIGRTNGEHLTLETEHKSLPEHYWPRHVIEAPQEREPLKSKDKGSNSGGLLSETTMELPRFYRSQDADGWYDGERKAFKDGYRYVPGVAENFALHIRETFSAIARERFLAAPEIRGMDKKQARQILVNNRPGASKEEIQDLLSAWRRKNADLPVSLKERFHFREDIKVMLEFFDKTHAKKNTFDDINLALKVRCSPFVRPMGAIFYLFFSVLFPPHFEPKGAGGTVAMASPLPARCRGAR